MAERAFQELVGQTVTAIRRDADAIEIDLGGVTWSLRWVVDGHDAGLVVDEDVPKLLAAGADVSADWLGDGGRDVVAVVPEWVRTWYGPARDADGRLLYPAGASNLCLNTIVLRFDGRDVVIGEDLHAFLSLEDAISAGALRGPAAASLALSDASSDLLVVGIVATLDRHVDAWLRDWRDMLIALTPFHHAAQTIGADVAELFRRAAEAGPAGLADSVTRFGARHDVTLGAFGFVLDDEPYGPRYHFVL